MRRIVLGAASLQLSLGSSAIWVGCRWLGSGLALIMLVSSAQADGPITTISPDAAPLSGVVIRLQLTPSTPLSKSEVAAEQVPEATAERDPEATAEQVPEVPAEQEAEVVVVPEREVDEVQEAEAGPATETDETSVMSVQFRRQAGRAARSAPTHSPALRRGLPERDAPAPTATPPKRAQATGEPMESEAGRTAKPPRVAEKSSDLELHPPLQLSSRADESPDKFKSLKSSPNFESSQWELSLDAPDAVPPSSHSLAAPGQCRAQVSDLSNERPLDSLAEGATLHLEPDDVPLLHEPHPFDAPAGESVAPIVKRSTLEAIPFSQRELQIESGIARCLNYYMANPENTVRRGPWALMHATLPFGVEGEVIAGNRRVNTIGWLSFNGTSGKQHMFQPTRTGFRPNVGPGVQGHDGQFLAILAQSKVRGDFPLQINGRNYTVMDLARYEMATCREKSELTFKLIGLSRYLEADAQWRDNRGRPWSLEKLLVEEMTQPINGAACGGVHRLMGFSYAIIERQAAGQPITGNWQRAQVYLDNYVKYALTLQNSDGSFSTNWFESRGMDPSVERRVQTSGHILEWLVYTLPDEHLRSPQIQLGIEFLLESIGREPQRDWPIGPRGHALRAMSLYSQRVFGAEPGQLKSYLAQVPQSASVR